MERRLEEIVITGDDQEEIKELVKLLHSEFSLKDLGNLNFYWEVKAHLIGDKVLLKQRKYILDILQAAGMTGCNPLPTPMQSKIV